MAATNQKTGMEFSTDAGSTNKKPLYEQSDIVYDKTEYPDGINSSFPYNPYIVEKVYTRMDATDAFVVGKDLEVSAETSSVTAPEDLSTIDENVTNDTNLLYPWWYALRRQSNLTAPAIIVHESDLKNLAGVKLRIAAAAATQTDPS